MFLLHLVWNKVLICPITGDVNVDQLKWYLLGISMVMNKCFDGIFCVCLCVCLSALFKHLSKKQKYTGKSLIKGFLLGIKTRIATGVSYTLNSVASAMYGEQRKGWEFY